LRTTTFIVFTSLEFAVESYYVCEPL